MEEEMITREEVMHVAGLAKLALTDNDAAMFTDHLEKIFEMVNMLGEVDTSSVEPTFSVTDMDTVLRDDVAIQANQAAELLANAPEHTDNLIKVPAILDEGGEG